MKRQRKGPNKEGPTLPRSLVAAAGEDDVRHHDARVFSATRRALSKKQLRRKLKADTKKQNVMRAERLAREARKRRKQNEATEPQHESSSGTEASEASEASDVADAAAAMIEAPVSAPGVDMPVAVAEPTRAAYVPPQLRRSQLAVRWRCCVCGEVVGLTLSGRARRSCVLCAACSTRWRHLRSCTLPIKWQNLRSAVPLRARFLGDPLTLLCFGSEPRSEVIRELTALIVGDVAADAATIVAGKVVAVFAALVAVLYHRHAFGTPLASALSEALLVRFEQVYAAGQSKSCVGAVTALGYLFVFDVVGPALLAGLCTRLVTSFTALDVELLLAAMQLAGMKLRTDAPGDLLELLAALQLAVKQHRAQQDVAFDQRTAFMMETLTAIKNNRYMHEDPHVAPLRKAMELTHSALQQPLRISWADLAHGCATGDRWWLRAGGAAPRSSAAGTSASSSSALDAAPEGDALLSALARKLRMNSDVRRRVFFVLMSAEGFADASEKIFKLQLKGKSERDVVYVIMEVRCLRSSGLVGSFYLLLTVVSLGQSCAHEKRYNPFYGYVAARLCENSKNFRLTFLYG